MSIRIEPRRKKRKLPVAEKILRKHTNCTDSQQIPVHFRSNKLKNSKHGWKVYKIYIFIKMRSLIRICNNLFYCNFSDHILGRKECKNGLIHCGLVF